MKPKSSTARNLSTLLLAATSLCIASAATKTWDSGGANNNWSTPENWDLEAAPSATGDKLVFSGTGETVTNNSHVTSLVNGAGTTDGMITFAAGAGSFILEGTSINWGTNANGQFIANNSGVDQTINLAFADTQGGTSDRIINANGATITLNGDLTLGNDRLFASGTAGTIVLNGNNTGSGTANTISAGTNVFQSTLRNSVNNTQLVLGSNTALGNAGTGTIEAGNAVLRGLVANNLMTLRTNAANLNLSGTSLVVNTAGAITYDGIHNATFSHLVNQGGNRDFNVSSGGKVTLAGGIVLSESTTARQIFINLSGAGGMTVDGKIYNTFNSGGITTTITGGNGLAVNGIFRKAGNGTMVLNGDSGATFSLGDVRIHAGTLVLGHDNALGAASTVIDLDAGATLDLNGRTIGQSFYGLDGTGVGGGGALVNSNAALPAAITANVANFGNITVGGAGDITVARFIGPGDRTITKVGAGTVTTNGTSHNSLVGWDIQAGTVVLANTTGFGADRGVAINGGTLRLGGANTNLVNDNEAFTVNSGTFDLNGKSETVGAVGGSGGVIRNGLAATATTLTVGGGSTSATYDGVIENGSGTLSLTKEGTGTQTLTGINTYTGATTISAGVLALGLDATISDSLILGTATPDVGTLDVTAKESFSQADVTGNGTLDIGSGKTITVTGGLAPGFSAGTLNVTGNLALTSSTSTTLEIAGIGGNAGTDSDFVNVTGSLTLHGLLAIVSYGGHDLTQTATYNLFDAALFTGDFTDVSVGANSLILAGDLWSGTFSGTTYSFSETTGVLTVIPEPAAALLGSIGMLILLRRRR